MTVFNVASEKEAQNALSNAGNGDIIRINGTVDINRLVLRSNVIFEGVSQDKSFIRSNANSGGGSSDGSSNGIITGTGLSNIEIRNLGFITSATGIKDGGHGDGRLQIFLKNCSGIYVHDCNLKPYAFNDFARFTGCKNVRVDKCKGQSGHDFICFYKTNDFRVTNCQIIVQTNTGIRFDGSSNGVVKNNEITGIRGTGWCLLEIENSVSNVQVEKNIFYDYQGSAGNNITQPVHASANNVIVQDNVWWNVGRVAVGTSKNNIENPSDRNLSSWRSKGYGVQAGFVETGETTNGKSNSGNSNSTRNNDSSSKTTIGSGYGSDQSRSTEKSTIENITGGDNRSSGNIGNTGKSGNGGNGGNEGNTSGISGSKVLVSKSPDTRGKFVCDGEDDQETLKQAMQYAVKNGYKSIYLLSIPESEKTIYYFSASVGNPLVKIHGDSRVRIKIKQTNKNDLPYF